MLYNAVEMVAKNDDLWLLIAVAVLGAIAKSRAGRIDPGLNASSSILNPPPIEPPPAMRAMRWVIPLPRLSDGREPKISDHYGPSKLRDGGFHPGVDLMYPRPRPFPKTYPLADHGSSLYEVPEETPALAAGAGKIWHTGRDHHGAVVHIDHGAAGGGRVTVYRHLESTVVAPHRNGKRINGGAPQTVEAGEVIGVVGYDPSTPAKIRHLHFELLQGTTIINPEPVIATWEVIS